MLSGFFRAAAALKGVSDVPVSFRLRKESLPVFVKGFAKLTRKNLG
jgi:hypothetical protein